MLSKKSTTKVRVCFLLLVVLKCLVLVFSDCNEPLDASWFSDYPLQNALNVNPDELDIASIALNFNQGRNFAANKGYYARKDKQLTAWRTSTPVFLHIAAQRVYQTIYPHRQIVFAKEDPYFRHYALGLQIISLLLFWASLFAFYEIALRFLRSETWALYAALLYGIIPSVLYYVGATASYENLALPLLVIVTALYCRLLHHRAETVNWRLVLGAAVMAAVATLIRPHTTLTFYAYGGFLLLYAGIEKYKARAAFPVRPVLTFVLFNWFFLLAVQVPIVYKNYKLFGAVFISNQAGFNFLLGHNEQARGSWLGHSGVGSDWDRYIAGQIPNLEAMNEYQEAQARRQLALQWIKDNPGKEVVLAVRKAAMFFLPDNYLHPLEFNLAAIFTAVIHLLAAIGGALYLYQLFKEGFTPQWFRQGLPYIAVFTALVFSILFFVDHRWRYYADPFLGLIALQTVRAIGSRLKHRVPTPGHAAAVYK
jgi:hypothetical protein